MLGALAIGTSIAVILRRLRWPSPGSQSQKALTGLHDMVWGVWIVGYSQKGQIMPRNWLLRALTILSGRRTGTVGHSRARLPSLGRQNEQGMMLLEVMIGGAFLAIAIVGIAVMFSEGQTYVVAEGDDRVAVALAQQKIEAVKSLGFACIPLASSPGTAGAIQTVLSGCIDDTETQAARIYNETPPGTPYNARFASRTTVVLCADPATFFPQFTCSVPPIGKLIRVQITPIVGKARAMRVETLVAVH
jgi:hypothetical protein